MNWHEAMTDSEVMALVFAEMDRVWPNFCCICGARPDFYIIPNGDWMVRCPDWESDAHRNCTSFPHTACCADRDTVRSSWNASHPIHLRRLKALGDSVWNTLGGASPPKQKGETTNVARFHAGDGRGAVTAWGGHMTKDEE